jgi:hypothetical protein
MAAGVFTTFNLARPKLANGTFDLDSNTFKFALTTSSQALTAAFAGTSTDCRYSDLTNEVANGSGYTTGGVTLGSVTWAGSAGTVTFDCADPAWTLSAGITFKYGVIYASSVTNSPLLAYFDADSGGGSVSPLAGTLTIQINASGIFTLTQT